MPVTPAHVLWISVESMWYLFDIEYWIEYPKLQRRISQKADFGDSADPADPAEASGQMLNAHDPDRQKCGVQRFRWDQKHVDWGHLHNGKCLTEF